MAYVIAEPCVATCETACVAVCPVDCIYAPLPVADIARMPAEERAERLAGLQLYIDPDECTSCGACASACPVDAIFDEDDLPPEWERYRARNAELAAARSGA